MPTPHVPPPADDYDTPWKDAVTRYFPEFIAFYFPDAYRKIDWLRGYTYVHVEIQGGHDSDFAERIFTYNYRLYDKYRRPVASLAVLADDREQWKPASFGYELFGCRHILEFPTIKSASSTG